MAKATTETTNVDTKTSYSEAFLAAQKELAAGVGKDAVNPHFRSDYADRTSILQFVLPILHKHGLILTQPLASPPENLVDHAEQDYLYMETSVTHAATGFTVSKTAKCPLPKSDPQGYGSAVTYLSRYSIVSFFSLPLLDDDDGNNASTPRATGKSTSNTNPKTTSPASSPKSSTTTAKTQAPTTTKKGTDATSKESDAKSADTTSTGAADPSVDDAAVAEAETGKPQQEVAGAKPKGKLWGSKSAK